MVPAAPADKGFYFPAEWHPHRATWLSWPHNPDTWPDLEQVVPAFVQLTAILSRAEEVCINVLHARMRTEVEALLAPHCPMDRVHLYVHPTNDAWIRDHGPSILINRRDPERRLVVDWTFNAWGGKYPPFDDDDRIPARLAEAIAVPRIRPGIVLEGGSIEVNGSGALLTTTSCLLNPNRNPTLDREALERILCGHFGVEQVLWLGDGIVGDDTDGHIDDLTRFVDEHTVVTAVETDRDDPNWMPLTANADALRAMSLPDGRRLNIVELPMPAAVEQRGTRLPASYLNFYLANEAVIVPVFGDPNDDVALRILDELFPTRRIHGIYARDVVWGLGAFHCLTQQEPLPLAEVAPPSPPAA